MSPSPLLPSLKEPADMLVAWLSGGTDSPMGGSAAMNLYWIIHECAWWAVITVLLGILFCFIADAVAWRSLPWRSRPA